MKALIKIFSVSLLVLLLSQCKEAVDVSQYPQPTDTIVKMDAEDVPKKAARNAWIELMHTGGDEDLDWRAVEYGNALQALEYKLALRKEYSTAERSSEIVADGNLKGTWREKGSINQAGSILVTKYDAETDMIYCISAGGTLWKGGREGFSWEVVNQDFRFSNHLLEIIYLDNDVKRLVAAIEGRPHYSDDEGLTWILADGPVATSGHRLYDYTKLSDGSMFALFRPTWNGSIRLIYSNDAGITWNTGRLFTDSDDRNYSMLNPHNTDELYVIEQRSGTTSRLYEWDSVAEYLVTKRTFTDVGFGDSKRAILKGIYHEDTLKLYSVNGDNEMMVSTDTAATWSYVSTLPSNMWSVGFEIMPSEPERMIYGEVTAWNSASAGKQWFKINEWWEYYNNVIGDLHADIMDIEEYTTIDGEHFTLISNHGGINITTDGGNTNENISLIGLNVGQYYDVTTHPTDRKYVYAGSQDQGFQRGQFVTDFAEDFTQVISGDYGHTIFTGAEDNLWTMYPGGAVSYYDSPKTSGPSAGYELQSINETVWIPPLTAHPDRNINAAFMAGGDIEGGFGAYMIRLDVVNGEIVTSQFDFDFMAASGGQVSAMEFSPFDHDKIFVATTNGQIFRSIDGGQDFERVDVNTVGSHYLYGSCLMHSKIDPNVIYLSGNGYSGSSVFVSVDGGENFEPMSEGLPPTLVFNVAANADESLLFAASEAGPYVYVKQNSEWYPLSGASTPNQTYWSVEYIPELEIARFGTYGRGVWDFEVEELVFTDTKDELTVTEISLYPNPTVDYIKIRTESPNTAKLTIINASGQTVVSLSISSEEQINVSHLETGVYYAKIQTEGRAVTKSFVKQ